MDGPSLVALQRPRFGTLMPWCGAVHIIKGYELTMVAGTPIFERGTHTGALPGRLVRAGHSEQALHAAE
jgi:N-acyl-D-aspartate/D-glutamate deacylase